MIKLIDILKKITEGKQVGTLYHFTTLRGAIGILTSGKIRKNDVAIAKNFLNKDELDGLNRIVSMYLDYAENQAKKHQAMTMKDWKIKLDAFLQFNEQEILTNAGKISAEIAKSFAESEFVKFDAIQDKNFESDFDREIKKLTEK